jgi:acetyl-CoA carboxylase carboxyl transferase subunit beta
MSWKDWRNKLSFRAKKEMPDGLWMRCEGCQTTVFKKTVEEAMEVCPECDYHFYLPTEKRIEIIIDAGSFEEKLDSLWPGDPLNFVDRKSYRDRLRKSQEETGLNDAIVVGTCKIEGRDVCLGVMDFTFMGGSMGSVVGEKVAGLAEIALANRWPLIIVSASGGARMQEGALSLMQMAKTCCALSRLKEAGILFISIMTNPTTAGVLASYAGVGDIIIAEPKALIGFTGPRVIRETIRQELPPGFQRSEFLLEHGLIDMIVHRKDLRQRLATILKYCPGGPSAAPEPRAPQDAPSPDKAAEQPQNGSAAGESALAPQE